MAFQPIDFVDIMPNPSDDGDPLLPFAAKTLVGTGKTFTDGNGDVWANVLIAPGFVDGWIVPLGSCTVVPDPAPLPFDEELFVRQCTLVDRTLNADPSVPPNTITADFLIARALFETGMTQASFAAPFVNGPFRLKQAEWTDFTGSGLAAAASFSPAAPFPFAQAYAAGWRMHLDGAALDQAAQLAAAGTPAAAEPFVASYLDLFHCYLAGAEAAIALRSPAAQLLSKLFSPAQIADIASRPKLAQVTGAMTAADFVALTEPLLASLLSDAFAKIQRLAPDELPPPVAPAGGNAGQGGGAGPGGGVAGAGPGAGGGAGPSAGGGAGPGGSAPWFDFARTQVGKITEANNADTIRSFFAAAKFGPVPPNTIPAWCGAFAAFCMQEVRLASTIPAGAAHASNWKSWGAENIPVGSSTVPPGAVVVLTEVMGTTGLHGHVAFFAGSNGKKVSLVGGNQSHAVTQTDFPITRIAAIRMTSSAPAAKGAAGHFRLVAAGAISQFVDMGDLIVDRFTRAGLGTDQHLRTALANAIKESKLDPTAHLITAKEQSFGLFQCNILGGLGTSHTRAELVQPEINIAIILKAAKASKDFVRATTLGAAMLAFVRDVERPHDLNGEIAARTAIANKL